MGTTCHRGRQRSHHKPKKSSYCGYEFGGIYHDGPADDRRHGHHGVSDFDHRGIELYQSRHGTGDGSGEGSRLKENHGGQKRSAFDTVPGGKCGDGIDGYDSFPGRP